LLQDPAERQRLAKTGRERVLANYTQTQIAQQTVEVYQEVLSAE
jgi:glycosyltransferase involved in cell wall biosynthesis